MLDLIRDSIHVDFGRMHGGAIGNHFYSLFGNALSAGKENFKSAYDTYDLAYHTGMREIMDFYWMIR